jgi:hypothetical protein
MGTDTGRYSSGGKLKFMENGEAVEVSGINIQNIPSRGDGKITRMLFKAKTEFADVECANDNTYILPFISEIETAGGWKYGKDIVIGDRLITSDGEDIVKSVIYQPEEKTYIIYV